MIGQPFVPAEYDIVWQVALPDRHYYIFWEKIKIDFYWRIIFIYIFENPFFPEFEYVPEVSKVKKGEADNSFWTLKYLYSAVK